MQLDRMVNFYKALGDKTRIKLLILLSANGSMSGLQLAEKLAVTPPTVSHHISKLKESSLIRERRDKNTIYYFLNEKSLLQYNDALITVLNRSKGEEQLVKKKENEEILQNFLLPDGRLKTIPAQRKKKLIIVEHILAEFQLGIKYSEKEINEHIKKFHDDYATIRREFIINHYMIRENGIYELNPQEMWAKIE